MNKVDKLLFSSIALSPLLTEATKGISVKATTLSRIMDTANGGVLAHGGMHRVMGGHSLVDLSAWMEHGSDYFVELSKDFITTYGLPLPGVETLATKGLITKTTATNIGSLNIGQTLGLGFPVLETIQTRKKIRTGEISANSNRPIISGSLKVAIGLITNNPLVILNGAVDIGLSLNDKRLERKNNDFISQDFNYTTFEWV